MSIGICTKCRGLMPLTRHHILPRSKGGGNEPENIRLVCRPCHDELDIQAGVRFVRNRNAHNAKKHAAKIALGHCRICNASLPKAKRIQIGIMQASEAAGLCQRCAWKRERELWHSLRVERSKETGPLENADLDSMIADAGISQTVHTVH